MDETKAARLLGVKEKNISYFVREDAFNGNLLEGWICREPDYRYGALIITKVNEEPCQQIIYSTPKLSYPFDKAGKFRWEKIQHVEVWDKLDGTNIASYTYRYSDKEYITFKSRLTPIVSSSSFGNFCDMWKECLVDNSWILKVIEANPGYNLSFEMYGSRNPITVSYKVPLAVALLFGVHRKDHSIKPPSMLSIPKGTNLPSKVVVDTKQDLTDLYCFVRDKMTQEIKDAGDQYILEGAVMYAQTLTQWKQFKIKAGQIENLHWSQSGKIPKIHLWNTALNVFESYEDPTIEDYKELLLEEYPETKVAKNFRKIEKCFKKAKAHMLFTAKVNSVWREARQAGFDVYADKAGTFRFMSKYFNKKEMRVVGTIVLLQLGEKQ